MFKDLIKSVFKTFIVLFAAVAVSVLLNMLGYYLSGLTGMNMYWVFYAFLFCAMFVVDFADRRNKRT